jgi:4'-phosphopantetheinyl transferase
MQYRRLLPLTADEVHIWYAYCDQVAEAGLLRHYETLLSADESLRHRRFLFAEHRHQFLISHTLLRKALSHYVDVAPAAWVFAANAHGKPEIAGPTGMLPLCFNLSHTRGLAVVAVTLSSEIGVDVENVQCREVGLELAERYFAADEVACLRRLQGAERKSLFFEYWTLKEAYLKARGLGLSLPLDAFAYSLTEGRPPQVSFSPPIVDDRADWQFVQLVLPPCYKVAVAVRRSNAPDRVIVVRHFDL